MKLEMVVYMIHEYNLDATIRDPMTKNVCGGKSVHVL